MPAAGRSLSRCKLASMRLAPTLGPGHAIGRGAVRTNPEHLVLVFPQRQRLDVIRWTTGRVLPAGMRILGP